MQPYDSFDDLFDQFYDLFDDSFYIIYLYQQIQQIMPTRLGYNIKSAVIQGWLAGHQRDKNSV
jgi:hypothetical protein